MAKQKTSAPKAAAAIMAEKKASAPKAAAAIMTKKKATASQAAAATPVNKAGRSYLEKLHPELLHMIFDKLPSHSGLAIKLISKSLYHSSKRSDGTDYLPQPDDARKYHRLVEQDWDFAERTGYYCYLCRHVKEWKDYGWTRTCDECLQKRAEESSQQLLAPLFGA